MEVLARPACEAGAVQPRSWGWERLWERPVARRCCSRPAALLTVGFILCHFSFLSWAHMSHSFTAQGAAERPFQHQLAFPPARAVPGVIVQRGPAYHLC